METDSLVLQLFGNMIQTPLMSNSAPEVCGFDVVHQSGEWSSPALSCSQMTKSPSSGLMGGMLFILFRNIYIFLNAENVVFLCQAFLLYFRFL
jgi:hypothetical protein